MAILIVNNKVFNYPDPGSQPGAGDSAIGYGEDATAWAKEVTSVLNSLVGRGDILTTTSPIEDNKADSDVQFLVFSSSNARAANVSYYVNRQNGPTTLSESGTLYLTYNDASGWSMAQSRQDAAGITFSINGDGQIKYTTTNMGNPAEYVGTITFQAKTLGPIEE